MLDTPWEDAVEAYPRSDGENDAFGEALSASMVAGTLPLVERIRGGIMGLVKDGTAHVVKVVHMTSAHPPFDSRVFGHECRTLATAGYDVVLVAQHNSDEWRSGVGVRAVPEPNTRLGRMFGTTFHVLLTALKENGSVYHFHDPELIPVGILLRLLGKKVVYDIHENTPKQVLGKYWIPATLRRVLARAVECLERMAVHLLNGIIAATPDIAARFQSPKVTIVQNVPAVDEFSATGEKYEERPKWIVYVGLISKARGIREIIEAMNLVPSALGARLKLVGRFVPDGLKEEVQDLAGWECVDYLGWQSREEVAELLQRARAGLVIFHPEPNHLEAQPRKLFEYMCAGLPVIASDFRLWRQILKNGDCGVLVDPGDPRAIARAIEFILVNETRAKEMGHAARAAIEEGYNWETEAQKLLMSYEKILTSGR